MTKADGRARTDVAFVMATYAMGGMELQLAALLRERPQWARTLNIDVITLSPTVSEHIEDLFAAQGARATLIDRNALTFPGFMLGLIRHFRKTRPHVVHTQLDGSAGTWGRLAAVLAQVPAIIQSDLSLKVGGGSAHRRMRRYLDTQTVKFLPNATAIKDRLLAHGVRPERIEVLMPGVDLARFKYQLPTHKNGGLVAGYLGRFDPVKRLDILLDALAAMPESHRPNKVLLAGDGPMRSMVEARLAADPWLGRHCQILGRQHDVPAFIEKIDYLILSSEVEGLPNAVLEAMAMGRPVVATRVSDVPLVVGDAGVLAEPADAASLAAALTKMQLASDEERAAMGRGARAKIEAHHDLQKIAERFWRVHSEVGPNWHTR